jgi:putative Holliday junction resolvase
VDWGSNRIGIAVSDETQLVATALATLHRRRGRRFPLGPFLDLVDREHPVGLLVGLPVDDEGREGESALAARALGESLARRIGLPLEWSDENFTTRDTLHHLRTAGSSTSLDRIDAQAAATLLQEWLDSRARR